jgi:hypothetical protein
VLSQDGHPFRYRFAKRVRKIVRPDEYNRMWGVECGRIHRKPPVGTSDIPDGELVGAGSVGERRAVRRPVGKLPLLKTLWTNWRMMEVLPVYVIPTTSTLHLRMPGECAIPRLTHGIGTNRRFGVEYFVCSIEKSLT